MNIFGKYSFNICFTNMFVNMNIEIENNNIITFLGESFFMNRWINDEFKTIKEIVLGKGTVRPDKQDISLSNETVRKNATVKVNLATKTVKLTCDFSAREINGTTEIGVTNGDILISHDVYEEIITPSTSTVSLTYTFLIETGSIRTHWSKLGSTGNTYMVKEQNIVIGVIEKNTQSGYNRKNSKEEVNDNPGSYYYDLNKRTLYIQTTNGKPPANHTILIKTE